MFSKIIRTGLIISLCAFGLIANAHAQEAIPPAKRELIQELLMITNSQSNYNTMTDEMIRQQEEMIPRRIEEQVAEIEDLTPQEREEMRKRLTERSLRISKRYRELLPQRINLKNESEAIILPLYHKYFNEQDIRDMISFYKSPAGRKTLEIMPRLMIDIVRKLQEVLGPKIEALSKEIIEEEKKLEKKEEGQPDSTPG